MGYAIRYRLRGSVGLCIGITAGNGLYILLAIIGWDPAPGAAAVYGD